MENQIIEIEGKKFIVVKLSNGNHCLCQIIIETKVPEGVDTLEYLLHNPFS